jgi:hypothetical protein
MKFLLLLPVLLISLASGGQHEWFADNARAGADPISTSVESLSGEEIKRRLREMGGFYRTGRKKILQWINEDHSRGFADLEEVVYWDDSAEKFVHAWQGRATRKSAFIFHFRETITGEKPKIQGEFYQ